MAAVGDLERGWPLITFTVRGVYLLARSATNKDEPFAPRFWVPLNGAGGTAPPQQVASFSF